MSESRSGRAGEDTLATLRATAGDSYLYNRNIGVVVEKDSTYALIESGFQPIYRRERRFGVMRGERQRYYLNKCIENVYAFRR